MFESPIFNTIPTLKELLSSLNEEHDEKIAEVDPHVEAVAEENPPKVEDETKEEKDLPAPKEISAPNKPKLESDKVKYTKLSDFVPAEVKRNETDEVPEVKNETEEEVEWEEAEEVVDSKVSKTHVIGEAQPTSTKVGMQQSGGKQEWGKEKGKQKQDSHQRARKQAKQQTQQDYASGN